MMMPANYSAVAENEVIYGGATIGDYLPEIWTSKNVKTFTTNLVTIVGNSFLTKVVSRTLGTMFGGTWGKDGVKLFGDEGSITTLFKYVGGSSDNDEMTGLNKFMTVLGVAAGIYNLGTASVTNVAGEKFVSVAGWQDKKTGFVGDFT